MWDEAREQADVELQQLHILIDTYRPLLGECRGSQPGTYEVAALAAMLHSFYTGVENILRRVALEIDNAMPAGGAWHRELLDSMAAPGPRRPAVLSHDTREALREYLDFRHLFRHGYSHTLRWDRMSDLVLGVEEALGLVSSDVATFFGEEE